MLFSILIGLMGCEGTLEKVRGSGDTSDAELAIASLASRESRSEAGLFILNYTNFPQEGSLNGVTLASGRLLSARDGRFKFEQSSSEPSKSYLIHYDPKGSLLVVFPGLKRAFRAPGEILLAPEMQRVLACYDGLRILLGQGNIWSDPSRSQFRVRGSRGAIVEQIGRPFRWHILFEDGDLLFPIKEMEAKSGSKRVVKIGRALLSYESLDYSNGGGGFPGKNVRGSQIKIDTWKFTFPKSPSSTEIQINPLNDTQAEELVKQGGLNAPEIPSDFQTEDIIPTVLMNWLNIH